MLKVGKLFLGIAAGSIINLAVAWGCAMWSTMTSSPSIEASADDILEWERLNRLEGAPFDPTIAQPDMVSRTGVHARSDSGFGYTIRTLSAITYLSTVRQRWFAQHAMTIRAGWPCRAFEGDRWEGESGWDRYVANPQVGSNTVALPKNEHERHVLSIIRPAALGKPSFRVLPYRPLWPGFAINTIFYAVILWLLFAAPSAIRRHVRRKRNQCPSCGYSLRGSGGVSDKCPECGTAIPSPQCGDLR